MQQAKLVKKYNWSITILSVMTLFVGASLFAGLYDAWSSSPRDSSHVAAWVQALGSIAPIFVAGFAFLYRRNQDKDEKLLRDVAILHSMQVIANELRRLCVLTIYQASESDAPDIYPDLPAEFSAIAELLSKLPIETVATYDQLFALIHLRRVAKEYELLMLEAPTKSERDGRFYQKHRNRLHDLQDGVSKISIELMSQVQTLAPGIFKSADKL